MTNQEIRDMIEEATNKVIESVSNNAPPTFMTPEEHKERHKLLHSHLDELFADYINHHPKQRGFTMMPLMQLIEWSHQQCYNPTEEPNDVL